MAALLSVFVVLCLTSIIHADFGVGCGAYECCLYLDDPDNFQQCCNRYGCCPKDCNIIGKGCCFNQTQYLLGSEIVQVEECCVKLVCGMEILNFAPFVKHTIATVQIPNADIKCPNIDVVCVDEFGIIRPEGSEWFLSKCIKCECREGKIICESIHHIDCFNHTRTCVDSIGVEHNVGESWWDPLDPCKYVTCTENGLHIVIRDCPGPTPPPHQSCVWKPPPGECCPIWHCDKTCVDSVGGIHEVGESWWDPLDPCKYVTCTENGLHVVIRDCLRPGTPPHQSCVWKPPPGECCPIWHCNKTCVDSVGGVHEVGESWWDPLDPCKYVTCTENGLHEVIRGCPGPGTPPHQSCVWKPPPGECCPIWHCNKTCVDSVGGVHEVGESWWDPLDPCKYVTCTENGLHEVIRGCPGPGTPPHQSCVWKPPPGECCPIWHCDKPSTCVDSVGGIHEVGESWQDPLDPCKYVSCTENGPVVAIMDCAGPSTPPHQSCVWKPPPGECCPIWHCDQKGCVDEQGNHRDIGESWRDPTDSCFNWICTEDGAIRIPIVRCKPPPPKPNEHCTPTTINCCPNWDCPGCFDELDGHREIGESWPYPTDPCYISTCTLTGIDKTHIPCPTLPPQPHQHCTVVARDCCNVWHCEGCVDETGVHHHIGDVWADPKDDCYIFKCTDNGIVRSRNDCPSLPPQPQTHCTIVLKDCCYEWVCKGCVDENGVNRNIGDVWTDPTDPCYNFNCTLSGIVRSRIPCPPLPPPPQKDCMVVEKDCCYVWHCETLRCVDENGVNRDIGEVWTDPTDSCYIFNCTLSGIIRSRKPCPPLPPQPHKHCTIVLKDCCYVWNCETGCVDENGINRDIGEVWTDPTDPCYIFNCTLSGIVRTRKPCPPLPPQPQRHCVVVEKDCCYAWHCETRGCVDENGVNRDIGEVWTDHTDPCYIFNCTLSGVVRTRKPCPPLPPQPQRHCMVLEKDCCYVWHCETGGCVDENSVNRDIGEVWTDPTDPCYIFNCTLSGIVRTRKPCPPLPPQPQRHCMVMEKDCCYVWHCETGGCVDETGVNRDIGEVWTDPTNPCYTFNCTLSGIVRSRKPCPPLPPQPQRHCMVVEKDCCFVWSCQGGCVDEQGVNRAIGDKWVDPSNPQRIHICDESGITTIFTHCPLTPPKPAPHCILNKTSDCCPTWDCSGSSELCPLEALDLQCVQPRDECQSDADCSDSECCFHPSCGMICFPGRRPGVCPAITSSTSCPFVPEVDECNVDKDCKYPLKCCRIFCANKCIFAL